MKMTRKIFCIQKLEFEVKIKITIEKHKNIKNQIVGR